MQRRTPSVRKALAPLVLVTAVTLGLSACQGNSGDSDSTGQVGGGSGSIAVATDATTSAKG